METNRSFTVVRVVKAMTIVMVTANGMQNLKNVFQTVETTKIAILKRNAEMENVFHLTQTVEQTRIATLKRNAKMKHVFDLIQTVEQTRIVILTRNATLKTVFQRTQSQHVQVKLFVKILTPKNKIALGIIFLC